jgi:hypothetical protein
MATPLPEREAGSLSVEVIRAPILTFGALEVPSLTTGAVAILRCALTGVALNPDARSP